MYCESVYFCVLFLFVGDVQIRRTVWTSPTSRLGRDVDCCMAREERGQAMTLGIAALDCLTSHSDTLSLELSILLSSSQSQEILEPCNAESDESETCHHPLSRLQRDRNCPQPNPLLLLPASQTPQARTQDQLRTTARSIPQIQDPLGSGPGHAKSCHRHK